MILILILSVVLNIVALITLLIKKKIGKNKFIFINAFIIFLTICLMIYNIFIEYSVGDYGILSTIMLFFLSAIINSSNAILKVWFKNKIHFLLSFAISVILVIYGFIIY